MAERSSAARNCFGCGSENERGLGMQFHLEDGHAVAEFRAEQFVQGYPGRVHGGVVVTMLDEAMSWAVYSRGDWSVTARLTTRFRRAVPLDEPLTVAGWVTRDRGRYLELRSEVRSQAGVLLADGEGLFVRVTGRLAEELRQQYEASLS